MKKDTISKFKKVLVTLIASQLVFSSAAYLESEMNSAKASTLIRKENTTIKDVPSPEIEHIAQVKEENLVILMTSKASVPTAEAVTSADVITNVPETVVEVKPNEETTTTAQETTTEVVKDTTTTSTEESKSPFDIVNPDPDMIYTVRSTLIFPAKPELKLWGVPEMAPTREMLPEFTGEITKLVTRVKSTIMLAPKPEIVIEQKKGAPLKQEAKPEIVIEQKKGVSLKQEARPEIVVEQKKGTSLKQEVNVELPVELVATTQVANTTDIVTTTTSTVVQSAEATVLREETTENKSLVESIIESIQNIIEDNNPLEPRQAQANNVESVKNAGETSLTNVSNESKTNSLEQGSSENSSKASDISVTEPDTKRLATTVAILSLLVVAAGFVIVRV